MNAIPKPLSRQVDMILKSINHLFKFKIFY